MWYEKSPISSKIGWSLLQCILILHLYQHPPCFPCLVIHSCITYEYPRVRRVTPNFSICANYSVLHSKILREVLPKWLHRTLFCLQLGALFPHVVCLLYYLHLSNIYFSFWIISSSAMRTNPAFQKLTISCSSRQGLNILF